MSRERSYAGRRSRRGYARASTIVAITYTVYHTYATPTRGQTSKRNRRGTSLGSLRRGDPPTGPPTYPFIRRKGG
ncbi:hypothetical protein GW17_00022143 [Ensete ventricosum]|nr:hypothetical protein GW17_00022143 [Ensete ventricosum]